MVNIQFGQVGGGGFDEDEDECMVIGVFEKKTHLNENLEEGKDEKEEDEIDLTLDLLGDGYQHIEQELGDGDQHIEQDDEGLLKKVGDKIEDDFVDISDEVEVTEVEAKKVETPPKRSTSFLNHLFSKEIAKISARVIAEQAKAKMNQEAVANLVEQLKKKNDELLDTAEELKKTKEILFTTNEALETKTKALKEKTDEFSLRKEMLETISKGHLKAVEEKEKELSLAREKLETNTKWEIIENNRKLLEASAEEVARVKEALETKSKVLKNIKKELSTTKKVLESKEVFETKLKSMTAELSSVTSAYAKKSASLKEKDAELAKTKESLEKALQKNGEELSGAKQLLKNNFEYQKVHEGELLKTLEQKSIALRANEKELLVVRESFETVSKQLENSETKLSQVNCLFEKKDKELKENISMQEEKAEQMKKFTVAVRKLTEEKKKVEEELLNCGDKLKSGDKKVSDLESLAEKRSTEIDTLKRDLAKKSEKVDSQRSDHKRELRKLEAKQEKERLKVEEERSKERSKQEEERLKVEAKQEEERERWHKKNKDLTKLLNPKKGLAGSPGGDPEATSSKVQKSNLDEISALKSEVESLKEKLKSEGNVSERKEVIKLTETLTKETEEKRKLNALSENLKREMEEKRKIIEKLTERVQEKNTSEKRERENTNDNFNLQSDLKKLETEVRDYDRANKALQKELRLKRWKIEEMESKENSSRKRLGSPSSWEPPSKKLNRDPRLQGPKNRDPRIRLRPIVIDGSNVAMLHGLNTVFSSKGVQIAVDYFRQRGHTDIVAFVPQFRKKAGQVSDLSIFERLEKEGVLVYTPSREVDGQRITPYDDNYILDRAAEKGGIVVTRDNFRDLKAEAQCSPERQEVIRKRILMPTFVKDDLMFSDDPMGRDGPSLDQLLRF